MLSPWSAIVFSKSEPVCPSPFFLSSAVSKLIAQNSFLSSSSPCSFFKVTTIWSMSLVILSNATFFATQRQEDEVQIVTVSCLRPSVREDRTSLGSRLSALQLQKAGACAWQRLLKQLQGIIVIQDADRVRQRYHLLRAHLLLLLVDARLLSAVLVHVSGELLVFRKGLRRVTRVVLQGDDLNTKLAHSTSLHFNRLGQGGDFLLLRGQQRLVVLHGSFLLLHHSLLVGIHGITHLLQNPNDFAAGRRILATLLPREEGQDFLAVRVEHGLPAVHHLAQSVGCCRLQEAAAHTLLDGCGCLPRRGEVGVEVSVILVEGGLLLRAEGGRLSHGVLGSAPVALMALEIGLKLDLPAFGCLDRGCHLWDLGLSRINRSLQITAARLTIAHKFSVELLGLLAFSLDLFLKTLQKIDYLSDGVRRMAAVCRLAQQRLRSNREEQ